MFYRYVATHLPAPLVRLLSTAPAPPPPPSHPALESSPRALESSLPPSQHESESENEKTPLLPLAREETVLYLAYGSNLSSAVFAGRRGVKAFSATPVRVPALTLVFDLPGLVYIEPAFANTRYRKTGGGGEGKNKEGKREEDGGEEEEEEEEEERELIGVVYEVSVSDYRTIIATEGGGAAYQDVVVPCYPLPASTSTTSSLPSLASPAVLQAHTLLAPAPYTRAPPGQASARYLSLLVTGAAEHGLPTSYQTYLRGLQPYRRTQWRQVAGAAVTAAVWVPPMLAAVALARVFSDREGRASAWVLALQRALVRAMWAAYDGGMRRVFGDGERTVVEEEEVREKVVREKVPSGVGAERVADGRARRCSLRRGSVKLGDEEAGMKTQDVVTVVAVEVEAE